MENEYPSWKNNVPTLCRYVDKNKRHNFFRNAKLNIKRARKRSLKKALDTIKLHK